MSKIDFIEIDNKTDRDLLVAVVTRLNTILQAQYETNKHLKKQNGTVASNTGWIKAFKWIIIVGVPSSVTLLVTYLQGLW